MCSSASSSRRRAARGLRRALRDRRGLAAVEFALVGLALMMLLLGSMDLARWFFATESLRTVAADTARAALIAGLNGAPMTYDGNGVPPGVTLPPGLDPNILYMRVQPAAGPRPGTTTVTVTARYDFVFFTVSWGTDTARRLEEVLKITY